MKKITVILSAFALITAAPVWAATYEIDPAHSSIEFKIRHLVGRTPGSFNVFSGTVDFDESTETLNGVSADIDAASIDTRNEKRDEHLRSADFFDVTNFSKATFVSKRVDPAAKKVVGDLTLHGVTKEVELDYTYNGKVDDKDGVTRIGGTADGKIDRRDFGINYDTTGAALGFVVDLKLEIEAVEKPA